MPRCLRNLIAYNEFLRASDSPSQQMTVISHLLPFISFFLIDQPLLQFQLNIAAAIIYLIMAFLHHHFDKSLTLEIIIEYILIALVVIIISLGLIS